MTYIPIDEFFQDFTVTATFSPDVNSSREIEVIFDNSYSLNILRTDFEVANLSPQVIVRTTDVSDVSLSSTIEVEGTTYNVTAIEPDGTGITVLRLSRN